eukprot:CAMPEP_0197905694 /NCGR_PEP_ID=MMETSP1439-20131203/60944_1 /TAXON_ID=66791 /ORGANISM="Gonyaulax spinifera, Strain CCMP409" /LENGTH=213 /DNA_ID=CAMNT_0043526983 /DNA_START=2 /DNA_END=644 /DNA_ORIENTATION=+
MTLAKAVHQSLAAVDISSSRQGRPSLLQLLLSSSPRSSRAAAGLDLYRAPVLDADGICVRDLAGAHQGVDFRKEPHEGRLNIRRLQGRRLDAREAVLLRKGQRLILPHCPEMPEVPLVADEHDDNVGIGMVAQLLKPSLEVLEGDPLGDVVNEQRAYGSPVVRARDRPVPLLPSCVPDLRLDDLAIRRDALRGKLDTDSRLRLEVELVPREPR